MGKTTVTLHEIVSHVDLAKLMAELPGTPSEREAEVAKAILVGKTNAEIAHMLEISEQTVKNHVYNLGKRTGLSTRGQLLNYAQRHIRVTLAGVPKNSISLG